MKVDGGLTGDLFSAGAAAQELEEAGYSGAWTAETSHDPFLPLLLGGGGRRWRPMQLGEKPTARVANTMVE